MKFDPEAFIRTTGPRWIEALESYRINIVLRASVAALVDSFFAQHPGTPRSLESEAFITALALDVVFRSSEPQQTQAAA